MITVRYVSLWRLLAVIWKRLLCICMLACATVLPLLYFKLEHYALDLSVPLVLGTAIAIFLGFRTNSSYERWWEARHHWNGISNESRNLARLLIDFFNPEDPDQQQQAHDLCRLIAAYARGLDRQLKGYEPPLEPSTLLPEDLRQRASNQHNPTLALLNEIGRRIAISVRRGSIDIRQGIRIEEHISHLVQHQGGCEKIRATVFPVHYTFFTKVFIWIFLLLLGFSLPAKEGLGMFAVPAIVLIGWVFFMVDGLGDYMQDPFLPNRNVVPMEALAREIEIQICDLIDDPEKPEPLQPVKGALY